MALIFTWMRIELRRRWRSLVVLALLVAISSGTVFTALAGARRAASAIDRLQAQTLPADAIVTPFEPHFDWDIVRALPQVEALATYSNTPNLVEGIADEDVTAFAPADSAAFDTIERPVVLAGWLADPARADEAVVTPKFVESFGRGIGDTATVRLNSPETHDAISRAQRAAPAEPDGPTVVTRIVGSSELPDYPTSSPATAGSSRQRGSSRSTGAASSGRPAPVSSTQPSGCETGRGPPRLPGRAGAGHRAPGHRRPGHLRTHQPSS